MTKDNEASVPACENCFQPMGMWKPTPSVNAWVCCNPRCNACHETFKEPATQTQPCAHLNLTLAGFHEGVCTECEQTINVTYERPHVPAEHVITDAMARKHRAEPAVEERVDAEQGMVRDGLGNWMTDRKLMRCPACKVGKSDRSTCFHCIECLWVECEWSSPVQPEWSEAAPASSGTGQELPPDWSPRDAAEAAKNPTPRNELASIHNQAIQYIVDEFGQKEAVTLTRNDLIVHLGTFAEMWWELGGNALGVDAAPAVAPTTEVLCAVCQLPISRIDNESLAGNPWYHVNKPAYKHTPWPKKAFGSKVTSPAVAGRTQGDGRKLAFEVARKIEKNYGNCCGDTIDIGSDELAEELIAFEAALRESAREATSVNMAKTEVIMSLTLDRYNALISTENWYNRTSAWLEKEEYLARPIRQLSPRAFAELCSLICPACAKGQKVTGDLQYTFAWSHGDCSCLVSLFRTFRSGRTFFGSPSCETSAGGQRGYQWATEATIKLSDDYERKLREASPEAPSYDKDNTNERTKMQDLRTNEVGAHGQISNLSGCKERRVSNFNVPTAGTENNSEISMRDASAREAPSDEVMDQIHKYDDDMREIAEALGGLGKDAGGFTVTMIVSEIKRLREALWRFL